MKGVAEKIILIVSLTLYLSAGILYFSKKNEWLNNKTTCLINRAKIVSTENISAQEVEALEGITYVKGIHREGKELDVTFQEGVKMWQGGGLVIRRLKEENLGVTYTLKEPPSSFYVKSIAKKNMVNFLLLGGILVFLGLFYRGQYGLTLSNGVIVWILSCITGLLSAIFLCKKVDLPLDKELLNGVISVVGSGVAVLCYCIFKKEKKGLNEKETRLNKEKKNKGVKVISAKKLGGILAIGILVATFIFTSENGKTTNEKSGILLVKLNIITMKDYETKSEKYEKNNQIIRKIAHFSIYLVFGIGIYLFSGSLINTIIFLAFFALLDESHQLLVSGRSGQLTDVLIDTSGGGMGALITKLIKRKVRAR